MNLTPIISGLACISLSAICSIALIHGHHQLFQNLSYHSEYFNCQMDDSNSNIESSFFSKNLLAEKKCMMPDLASHLESSNHIMNKIFSAIHSKVEAKE